MTVVRDYRNHLLHLGVMAFLGVLFFAVPEYHLGVMSRIMVLSVYAMGYNLLLGYTGLLSLGHALFFAAGMYGCGLAIRLGGVSSGSALVLGVLAALLMSLVVGFLSLRTKDVAFMIVTLMFAQAGYLTILQFGDVTGGDEGFVVERAQRILLGADLSNVTTRYWAALVLFSSCLLGTAALVTSRYGRSIVAVRENEERARLLGYDTHGLQYVAILLSGVLSGLSGAAYALLFGYVGATFATVQYSILPLLWVLLGGVGTTIGPLIGVTVMVYLIDFSSSLTSAYMLIVGIALLALCLFVPKGLTGELRKRAVRWLP